MLSLLKMSIRGIMCFAKLLLCRLSTYNYNKFIESMPKKPTC